MRGIGPSAVEPWHVDITRDSILRVFGEAQLELARPCLRSLSDRQFYARFHYQRADATLRRYVRVHLRDKSFVPIALGADEAEWNRFNLVIRKLGADLVACVQSMHSLPDILASAVYYSLQLDRNAKPPPGRYVNHRFLLDELSNRREFSEIATFLRQAVSGSKFKHLAALANQAKHYSIVFPSLNADLTGERAKPYMVAFPEFKTARATYPQVFVADLLPPVHEQLSKAVVGTGHALNNYLQRAA